MSYLNNFQDNLFLSNHLQGVQWKIKINIGSMNFSMQNRTYIKQTNELTIILEREMYMVHCT